MKTVDVLRIAARGALGKGGLLPIVGIAACVFCLCFAGAGVANVHQEQALPCELTVAAGQVGLSSSSSAQLEQIPGVVAVTPTVQFQAKLTAGEYTANLTMTGLRGDYVNQTLREGVLFPENAAMPYLMLNRAACEQFRKGTLEFGNEEPDIRWLGTGLILQLSEGDSVSARVCGILDGKAEEQPPLVLTDYENAQALLRSVGQPADPQQILVRVQDSGAARQVAEKITAMGYAVAQPNEEMEQLWTAARKEADYLILLGLLSLCLAVLRMRGARKLALCRDQGVLYALGWLGVRRSTLRWINLVHTLLTALYGNALGLVFLSIPAMLQRDVVAGSSFALPVPWWVWSAGFALSSVLFIAASQAKQSTNLHPLSAGGGEYL